MRIILATFISAFIKVTSVSRSAFSNAQIAEFPDRAGKELPPAYSNLTHTED